MDTLRVHVFGTLFKLGLAHVGWSQQSTGAAKLWCCKASLTDGNNDIFRHFLNILGGPAPELYTAVVTVAAAQKRPNLRCPIYAQPPVPASEVIELFLTKCREVAEQIALTQEQEAVRRRVQ